MMFIVAPLLLLAAATAVYLSGFTTVTIWAIDATVLAWCSTFWKKQWVGLTALGLFGLALLKSFLTPGFLRLPPGISTLLMNPRAISLAAMTAGMAVSAFLLSRLPQPEAKRAERLLTYGWIGSLFLLVSLEISDHFLRLMSTSFGDQKLELGLYRNVYLSAVWMLYSLPLMGFGLKRQSPPLFLSGVTMISISVGLGGIWSMTYPAIEQFRPVANARSALLMFLIVGVLLHTQFLSNVRRRYHRLEALMHLTWGLLLFELCTVETNDYFRHLMTFSSDQHRAALAFNRFMTLSAVWMALSLPLVRLGLARKMRPTLYLGLWSLLLSVCMAGVRGISYEPIESYSLLANYRALILGLIVVGAFIQATWIRYSGQLYGILYESLTSLRIAIVILVLVLVIGETRDYFEQQLYLLGPGNAQPPGASSATHLETMKQLALSLELLVFSFALMGIGLWRKVRTYRIFAIVIFVVLIGKMLLIDLSSLEPAPRTGASVGLVAVLLAVAFFSRRYKVALLADNPIDDRKGKEHIIF